MTLHDRTLNLSIVLSIFFHFVFLLYLYYGNIEAEKRLVYIEDIELIEELPLVEEIEEAPIEKDKSTKGIFSLQAIKQKIQSVLSLPIQRPSERPSKIHEAIIQAETPPSEPSLHKPPPIKRPSLQHDLLDVKDEALSPSPLSLPTRRPQALAKIKTPEFPGLDERPAEIQMDAALKGLEGDTLPILSQNERPSIKIADIGQRRVKKIPKGIPDLTASTTYKPRESKIVLANDQYRRRLRRKGSRHGSILDTGDRPIIKIDSKERLVVSDKKRVKKRGDIFGSQITGLHHLSREGTSTKIHLKGDLAKTPIIKRRYAVSGKPFGFKPQFELEEEVKIAKINVDKTRLKKTLDTPPPEPKITPPKPPAKKKEKPKVVKKVSKRQKVAQSLLDKEMEEIFRQTPTDEDVKEVKKPSKKLVEITGLLSKRGIRRSYLPTYPEWAQQKGIEAEVMIHFTVSPSGHVLDAHIKLTSGYGELDRLAMKALKRWVFEPLPPEVKKINQWGLIVFRFLLQ